MKWTDKKIVAAGTVAFLTGTAMAAIGAIVWKSAFAIAIPMLAGLGAAIIIVSTAGREE